MMRWPGQLTSIRCLWSAHEVFGHRTKPFGHCIICSVSALAHSVTARCLRYAKSMTPFGHRIICSVTHKFIRLPHDVFGECMIPFDHRIICSVSSLAHLVMARRLLSAHDTIRSPYHLLGQRKAHSVTVRCLRSGNDTSMSPHHLFGQRKSSFGYSHALTEQMMR